MSDKSYLKLLYIAALMAWLGSAYIFFFRSPAEGMGAIALFIFSISVSLFLTFTFISAILAKVLAKLPRPVEPGPAIRRGFLLTVFAVGLLTLSMYHLLNVFDTFALGAVIALAESFFHTKFKTIRGYERAPESEE